ncbi:MAG: DUF1343 domain-containing protein [Deltaproteobacteria bacterium]|jgi:uncharacterized protein YbbC (DUF1343 family)|nr:DUF1343 domain-containing protein [Deltaproteobacteria bacterium]
MSRVKSGLEQLLAQPAKWADHARLGLLSNPASVDPHLNHARILINDCFPGRLKALYSPQHGFFAEKQDNMVESDDMVDAATNLPVYSLYGCTRIPTANMLDPIDVLIIDLQDVGTRVYTFIYTVSYCLEAAKKYGKKVVVLDRPNPINGSHVEGNCLSEKWASFVGRYPVPMRHGLTIGELSNMFNRHFGIDSDLTVIPMAGWKRCMYFDATGLPWIAPSPNLPTVNSTMVYPGQVIWEGTNVSEGRGTTLPFEIFGAPYFETRAILNFHNGQLAGAILRPIVFEPTSNKWQETSCNGFQIHVTDPDAYRPYKTSLQLLQSVIQNHPDKFQWKSPPYEYETKRLPIDLIVGDQSIRQRLEAGEPVAEIEASWQDGLEEFRELSRKYYLYS